MSGSRVKSMRRTARRCINRDLKKVCISYFNSMCELPFCHRVRLAFRIVFKMKRKERQ